MESDIMEQGPCPETELHLSETEHPDTDQSFELDDNSSHSTEGGIFNTDFEHSVNPLVLASTSTICNTGGCMHKEVNDNTGETDLLKTHSLDIEAATDTFGLKKKQCPLLFDMLKTAAPSLAEYFEENVGDLPLQIKPEKRYILNTSTISSTFALSADPRSQSDSDNIGTDDIPIMYASTNKIDSTKKPESVSDLDERHSRGYMVVYPQDLCQDFGATDASQAEDEECEDQFIPKTFGKNNSTGDGQSSEELEETTEPATIGTSNVFPGRKYYGYPLSSMLTKRDGRQTSTMMAGSSTKVARSSTIMAGSSSNETKVFPFPSPGQHGCEDMPYICRVCLATFVEEHSLRIHCLRMHGSYSPVNLSRSIEAVLKKASKKDSQKGSETKAKSDKKRALDLKACQLYHLLKPQSKEIVKNFKCDQCGAAFTRSGHLRNHKRTHSGDKPYMCSECSACFTTSTGLRTHMWTHTNERPFICKECGSTFTQSGDLKRHMRTHTGDRPYGCAVCGSTFVESSHLKAHIRIHTGDRPYVCKTCGASFTQSSNLKGHMAIHTERERSFVCKQCGAAFTKFCILKRHMLTHTGDKPHVCYQCCAAFLRLEHLRRHMKRHENDVSPTLVKK